MKYRQLLKKGIAVLVSAVLCVQAAAVTAMELDTELLVEPETVSIEAGDVINEAIIAGDAATEAIGEDAASDDIFVEEIQEVELSDGEQIITETVSSEARQIVTETVSSEAPQLYASEEMTEGDFQYTEVDGNHVAITGYTGPNYGTVVIPEKIGEYTVSEIGMHVFDAMDIEAVVLPDTITTIDYGAFLNCDEMTSIDLGEGLTTIGISAFESCERLTSISFPDTLTQIGIEAFRGCEKLTSVAFPDSVTSIGMKAFADCISLASVNYPRNLTTCGGEVFADCPLVTRIEVPDGLQVLPASVFAGWNYLTTVSLPQSLTVISASAFAGCTNLQEIQLPDALTTIEGYAFSGCSSLEQVTFPDSLTTIEGRAFENCISLTAVNYPVNLSAAGVAVFTGCSGLTSITVPEGVTSLPDNVFYGCENFAEIKLPLTLQKMGNYALFGCSGLESIELPSGLTEIGNRGLAGCTKLAKLTLPDTVTVLGTYALMGCTGLKSVNYPQNLQSAGTGIFYNCNNLTSITVPEGVAALPDNVFEDARTLVHVELPSTLLTLGTSAFKNCYGIRRMILPESVTSIGTFAFYGCSALEDIWIDQNVTAIDSYAFYDCSTEQLVIHGIAGSYAQTWAEEKGYTFSTAEVGAEDAVISGRVVLAEKDSTSGGAAKSSSETDTDSTTSVGISGVQVSVYDCTRQKIVMETVTDEEGYWSYSEAQIGVAYKITYLHSDYTLSQTLLECVAEAETVLPEVTGTLLWEKMDPETETSFTYEVLTADEAVLVTYSGNSDTVILPATIGGYKVAKLGDALFADHEELTRIRISEYVTDIGDSAFENCTDLELVRFAGQTSAIGDKAFAGCTALMEFEFPGSLTSIGERAFCGCSGLECLVLPDGVTEIGAYAFLNCTNLKAVYVEAGSYAATWAAANNIPFQYVISEIAEDGTKHKWITVIEKEPACGEEGSQYEQCLICNETRNHKILPATGNHKYGSYQVLQEATVFAAGRKVRNCKVCGQEDLVTLPKLKPTITLNVSSIRLKVNQSTSKIKVTNLAKGDYVKSWTSDKPKVATVSETGTIKGVKAGKAVITVTLASKKTAQISVVVQKSAVKTTKILGLSSKITLEKGKSTTLKPVLSPITSVETVKYKTSNKKVAVVTAGGKITAKGAGTAKITATAGKAKFVVTVTVPKTKNTAIKNVPKTKTLKKGKFFILQPKVNPAGSDEKITYSTSNKKIVTVNAKGKMTAKKSGTAVITVKSGRISAACKVTVP